MKWCGNDAKLCDQVVKVITCVKLCDKSIKLFINLSNKLS